MYREYTMSNKEIEETTLIHAIEIDEMVYDCVIGRALKIGGERYWNHIRHIYNSPVLYNLDNWEILESLERLYQKDKIQLNIERTRVRLYYSPAIEAGKLTN